MSASDTSSDETKGSDVKANTGHAGAESARSVSDATLQKATFGAGCFWCVEAVFAELNGVHSAISGYSGGNLENPTYKQVCTGTTGHAEVVQVSFDPHKIPFERLLEVFWLSHDPTTLNRQGADVGTQYRSAVFYHDEAQKKTAERIKQKLQDSGAFDSPPRHSTLASLWWRERSAFSLL